MVIMGKLKRYYFTLDTSLKLHEYEVSSKPDEIRKMLRLMGDFVHTYVDYF